jgi:hypothetical protein
MAWKRFDDLGLGSGLLVLALFLVAFAHLIFSALPTGYAERLTVLAFWLRLVGPIATALFLWWALPATRKKD